MKQYIVELTSEKYSRFQQIVAKGRTIDSISNRLIFCSKPIKTKTAPNGLIRKLPRRLNVMSPPFTFRA